MATLEARLIAVVQRVRDQFNTHSFALAGKADAASTTAALATKISVPEADVRFQPKQGALEAIAPSCLYAMRRLHNPLGGSFGGTGNTPPLQGRMKIKLPADSNRNVMMTLKVTIYDYNHDKDVELTINGYDYDYDIGWIRCSAYQTGGADPLNIVWGNDADASCIWIGDATTVWEFAQISIDEVHLSWGGAATASWAGAWSIECMTTDAGYGPGAVLNTSAAPSMAATRTWTVDWANKQWNNRGELHGAFTDPDSVPFGPTFVQAGPNTPSGQRFYINTQGLGVEYPVDNAHQTAFARNIDNPSQFHGYLYYRQRDGAWNPWSKVKAGYADTAAQLIAADGQQIIPSGVGWQIKSNIAGVGLQLVTASDATLGFVYADGVSGAAALGFLTDQGNWQFQTLNGAAYIYDGATARRVATETWANAKFLTAQTLTKADVGLSNVDNTSDANKPISTAQQTALNARVQTVNGTAPDGAGNVVISTPAKATGADMRTGTDDAKFVTAKAIYDAAAPVALTDAATIAVDLAAGINFTVTLGGNRTLGAPSNAKPGASGVIIVKQDATGSRTLAYNTAWKFFGGAPALSTAANAVDVISYVVETSGVLRCGIGKAST